MLKRFTGFGFRLSGLPRNVINRVASNGRLWSSLGGQAWLERKLNGPCRCHYAAWGLRAMELLVISTYIYIHKIGLTEPVKWLDLSMTTTCLKADGTGYSHSHSHRPIRL